MARDRRSHLSWLAVAAVLPALLAGCGGDVPTNLLLTVQNNPAIVAIDDLRVDVYDNHGVAYAQKDFMATATVGTELGTVVIYARPDGLSLRLYLQVGSKQKVVGEAVGKVTLDPSKQTEGTLMLNPVVNGRGAADQDGDHVPDAIDNCPKVANPKQEDALGNGIGDACRTAGAMK